jgi:RNase P subunit RPR2
MDLNALTRERISVLLGLAKDFLEEDGKLSKYYVSLARKLAMKKQIKLGRKLFCRECDTVFVHGKSVKARLDSKKRVLWVCLNCGKVTVIGMSTKKKTIRNKEKERMRK